MKRRVAFFLVLAFGFVTVSPEHGLGQRKQPCVVALTDCPVEGCGGDPGLNKLKNRTDTAQNPEEWKLGQIIGLNEESPTSWSKSKERDELEDLGEGSGVVVKGYLINAHVSKTPESCNCFLKGPTNSDFHLNLVHRKTEGMHDSVVIEVTPRLRLPGWTLQKLDALAEKISYVRVTGWLMFDTQHASFGHMPRATAWEIHPVTGFEVCTKSKSACDKGQGWKRLENHP